MTPWRVKNLVTKFTNPRQKNAETIDDENFKLIFMTNDGGELKLKIKG